MSIAPSDQSEDGRPASSLVTFTLEDQYGEPEASKNVTLTVDQTGTAEFFDAQTGSWEDSITLSTDAETGEVAARVRAKTDNDHTQFRVIATYEALKAYSKPIVINSTLPSQDNFSLTSDNYAPDSWRVNGVTSSLTIFAADIMGNRIRENTYVNFKTNEGSINPDCVITDGKCTVTWESLDTSQPYATITASTHGRISSTQTGTIESTIRLLMSTNENITAAIAQEGALNAIDGTRYCATASISLSDYGYEGTFAPPVGTTITFNINEGELAPGSEDSRTIASSSSLVDATEVEFCTRILPAVEEYQVEVDGELQTFERYKIDVSATATTPGDTGTSHTSNREVAPPAGETWNNQN